MSEVAISGLSPLTVQMAEDDLAVYVDISDTSQAPTGTTKKLTRAQLFTAATVATSLTVAGTLAVSGNVAIATNKFTVAAASGDTVVAGTLNVTGLSTLTAGVVIANNGYLQSLTTGAVSVVVIGVNASNKIILDNSSLGVQCNGGFEAMNGITVTGTGTFTAKVGVGTATPATSALVELSSTTGALLLSRMTTTQRDALTAVNGMIIYNSTASQMQGYIGGSWTSLI